ncbi:MAG: MlaD family protein [Verrucomicrobiales bacterium]|jgi:ABC-type transporter Mla subunit MlaD|nr:MlaD family protein [Verrucomicrobiales bacterium]
MNSDVNYYRIGIFVIGGFVVLLLGLFALGAKNWFEPQVHFETYFDETIGSLGIGAPVKFRGVTMGKVTRIDFTPNVYPEPPLSMDVNTPNRYRYILVEFDIKKSMLTGLLQGDFKNNLNAAVKRGMRVRVDMSGIVGGNYLEIDRPDEKSITPPPPINWQPRYYYIPSTSSTITQIVNSIDQTLRSLGKVDFDEIQKKLVTLISQFDQNSQQFNILVQQINHMNLTGVVDNFRVITEDFKDVATWLKNDPSQVIWSTQPPPAKSLEKK